MYKIVFILLKLLIAGSAEVIKSVLVSPRRSRREEEVDNTVDSSPKRVIDRAKARPSPDRALPDIVNSLAAAAETSDSDSGQWQGSM